MPQSTMDRLRDKMQQTQMQQQSQAQSQNASNPINRFLASNDIVVDDVDTNVDTSTNSTNSNNPAPTNRPPVCGPICQKKKKRRTYMIVGIGIAVLGITYFIFRKK